MTFFASGDRIKIEDGSTVVFDTNTPMPHILQTLTTNVTHSFSNTTKTNTNTSSYNFFTYACPYMYTDPCAFTLTSFMCCRAGNVETCYGFGQYRYCFTMYSQCATYYTCDVCQFGTLTGYADSAFCSDYNSHDAKDESTTYDIGTLTSGATPDFIIVVGNGSRTSGGTDFEYGSFITAIPANQNFAANGSTILESSFYAGGASWLRRLCSVYVDGDTVKVEFKSSIRGGRIAGYDEQFACGGQYMSASVSCNAGATDVASDFDIDFTVYAGKFTS